MKRPPHFGACAPELRDRGFEPIPITPPRPGDSSTGKRPAMTNWQAGWREDSSLNRYADCGIGLLTRRLPAIDIDVRDATTVAAILKLADEALGWSPQRIGAAPKCLLPFRSNQPFPKIKSRQFILPSDVRDAAGYKPHAVEVLSDGQQFVAYGIHPGTGRPYTWLDGAPLDLEWHDLSEIDERKARAFILATEQLLLGLGARPLGGEAAPKPSTTSSSAKTSARGLRAARHRVQSALMAIPNVERHYDDWLNVGIALKGALGDDGRELFHRFSEQSAKYDAAFTDRAWDSLGVIRARGAGSIFAQARANGWQEPSDSIQQTSLPPYFNGPTLPPEDSLSEQKRTINDWHRTAVIQSLARREAEEARRKAYQTIDLELGQKFDIEQVDELPEPVRRERRKRRSKASRCINKEVAQRHGLPAINKNGARLLITGSQGSGKTRAAVEALAQEVTGAVAAYLAPTAEKAEEAHFDYRQAHGRRPAMVVYGRAALDPRNETEHMCPRHKVVQRAASLAVEVRQAICESCPLNAQCGYLAQERAINAASDADLGAVFFAASNYAFLPAPFDHVDVVIIDESIIDKAHGQQHIAPDALSDDARWGPGRVSQRIERRAVAVQVRQAFEENSKHALQALRDRGVTAAKLKNVINHLRKKKESHPNIDGMMTDAEINRHLDAIERSEHRRVERVLVAIKREFDQPRCRFNAITFEAEKLVRVDGQNERQPRIVARYIKRLAPWISNNTAILLLDGTGSLELNRFIFGDELKELCFKIERQAKAYQTNGKGFSKRSLLGGSHTSANALSLMQQLTGFLRGISPSSQAFIAMNKSVQEVLDRDLPANFNHGHFGALLGVNRFERCETAVVLGREQPPVAALEDIARGFAARRPDPFTSLFDPDSENFGPLVPSSRRRRMRNGSTSIETVDVHPDLTAQAVLEQIREAGVVQAVDRVRPIFNQRTFYLLNALVVDVTIDAAIPWRELRKGRHAPTRLEEAYRRAGILLLSSSELARVFPDLWSSTKAAKRHLEALREKGPKSLIDSYMESGAFLLWRYWRTDDQTRPYRALIPALAEDPKVRLEAITGPILRMLAPVAGVG